MTVAAAAFPLDPRLRLWARDDEAGRPEDRLDDPTNRRIILAALARAERVLDRVEEEGRAWRGTSESGA